jgi:hypothetical protein
MKSGIFIIKIFSVLALKKLGRLLSIKFTKNTELYGPDLVSYAIRLLQNITKRILQFMPLFPQNILVGIYIFKECPYERTVCKLNSNSPRKNELSGLY